MHEDQQPPIAQTENATPDTPGGLPDTLPADFAERGSFRMGKSDLPASQPSVAVETFNVDLPSRGLLYPGQEPKTVTMRLPGTEEEAALQAPGGDFADKLAKVIDACIVDSGSLSPKDLLVTDRFYMLLALRIQSFGPEYDIQFKCQHCGAQQKSKLDLIEDLDLVENDTPDDEFVEPFEVTLPNGQTIGFRLLRQRHEASIQSAVRHAQFKKADSRAEYFQTLGHQIVSVNGEDVGVKEAILAVKGWTWRDKHAFDKARAKYQTGLDTEVLLDCNSCGSTNQMGMPFTAGFLNPDVRS